MLTWAQFQRRGSRGVALLLGAAATLSAAQKIDAPEVRAGERLFLESRFAQRFFADGSGEVNMPDGSGEAALVYLAQAKASAPKIRAPFADQAINCRVCHLVDELKSAPQLPGRGVAAYTDYARRSPVPQRSDGRGTTPRNAQSLVGALEGRSTLLHFDGEFATVEALIVGTYTGRNFGWLPEEEGIARKHFANVIRKDKGRDELAEDYGKLPYRVLLKGTDPAIPAGLRLPEALRFDAEQATDDEVLLGCARVVKAYLASLKFSRDADGRHNGSPYDAFLAANDLPRGPAAGETPAVYAQRLRTRVAGLTTPKFVDEPNRKFKYHDQPFRFGETEWRGLRIFFGVAGEAGPAPAGAGAPPGAGNCAACHVPPHFTDFAFHNTGTTQEDFDALNGAGEFLEMFVPTLAERDTDFDAWLPPTPRHPKGLGPFFSVPVLRPPPHTDLGLWNVYGNPDLPEPQAGIERLLNADGRLTREEVLTSTIARFKTPGLRDLGQSGPYLHTGRFETIEDVLRFYQRTSALARAGRLRNAPPEFAGMNFNAGDVAALAAFLRALNEDYD
ncbi:MAG: hypothetical protein NTV51_23800 [Verrucomicrobia bacterium]|nr:hypothetical protein [Verrucomicrobiota bacterium]